MTSNHVTCIRTITTVKCSNTLLATMLHVTMFNMIRHTITTTTIGKHMLTPQCIVRTVKTVAAGTHKQHIKGLPRFEPPLRGVRVLDLGRILAAPYASMMLADLGADVIKIEHPTRGDDTRAWQPPGKAPTVQGKLDSPIESAYFIAANRNKRSCTVNLKHPKGKAIIEQLVRNCDVLIENYLPGKLAEMGLGYNDCLKLNPNIIYASISGYGTYGAHATKPGYDVMIEAEAGLMHITGTPEAPVKVGVAVTDITTGLFTYSSILAALYSRQAKLARGETEGCGVWIDAALFDCQLGILTNIASNYLVAGQEAVRLGNQHPSIVPYQVFATKDGHLMVGAGNDLQFQDLCRNVIDRPDMLADKRFSSNQSRVKHRTVLIPELESIFKTRTNDEWLTILRSRSTKVAYSPLNNIAQTFAHDQIAERGMVTEAPHPTLGSVSVVSHPVSFNGAKMDVVRAPPTLGEHTDEVLRELGHSDVDIATLHREGAV